MTAFLQPDPVSGLTAKDDPAALAVVDPSLLSLSLLMDEFSLGVVIMARSGRIEYINRAARTELDDARVLTQSLQAELPALHAKHNPRAQAQLDDALTLAAAGRRSLVSLHSDDGPLDVVVVPFNGQPGAAEPLYALYFVRTSLCASPMLSLFARHHRLTQTEQTVLAALCRGHAMPEIATQLGVAISTVRTHVRNLCIKTGSNGMRELVYQVAVLPPVEPAPPHPH